MKMRQTLLRILIGIPLVLFALSIIYPLIWMMLNGFKTDSELFLNPFGLPSRYSLDNFIRAWNIGIGRYFLNSIFVTTFCSIATTFFCAMTAFPLSRYRFKGRHFWFMFILCGLMLAPQVSLISNYKLLQMLKIYDTYWALILPYIAFRIPFTVFLLWSYFMALPREVEESALIDGCSSFQIFIKIILPMSTPILATSALLTARYVWNDFMFSLVFTESSTLKTIPYGLNSIKSALDTDWGILLAGLAIACIPIIILFIALQKYLVRGMTAGSVKG
jgi:raffinose/stachyose/melibiose transport system permease protein